MDVPSITWYALVVLLSMLTVHVAIYTYRFGLGNAFYKSAMRKGTWTASAYHMYSDYFYADHTNLFTAHKKGVGWSPYHITAIGMRKSMSLIVTAAL